MLGIVIAVIAMLCIIVKIFFSFKGSAPPPAAEEESPAAVEESPTDDATQSG